VLDAIQDHRPPGPVDAADRAPVAVPHSDPVLVAARRPSCGMRREWVGGKSLDPDKKRPPVAHRQCRKLLDGTRRNDQPRTDIIDGGGRAVNDRCR
jgi:hypothetical protein